MHCAYLLQSASQQQQQQLPRHHAKQGPCYTRPPYRDGRRKTAVKAYCISDESQYLIIYGVPAIGLTDHVTRSASRYGKLESVTRLDNLSSSTLSTGGSGAATEAFTDTYLIKFARINSARHAKRRMDDLNFFGGLLHVVYAPEFESVEECRMKLKYRCQQVRSRLTIKVTDMATADAPTTTTQLASAEDDQQPSSQPPPDPQPPMPQTEHRSAPPHPAVLQANLAMSSQRFSPTSSTKNNNRNLHTTATTSSSSSSNRTATKRPADFVGPVSGPPSSKFRRAHFGHSREAATAAAAAIKPSIIDRNRILTMRPRQVILQADELAKLKK